MSLCLAALKSPGIAAGPILADVLREKRIQPKRFADDTGWDMGQLSLAMRDLAPVDLRRIVKADWDVLSTYAGRLLHEHFHWWIAQFELPYRMAKAELPEKQERKTQC